MSATIGLTGREQQSAAWIEGATAPVDVFGDVSAECYFTDPTLAEAWREGAGQSRDIHGDANLANNPYEGS